MTRFEASVWSRKLDRATLFLAVLAGAAMFAVMLIIAVGVLARYLFALPILGSNEMIQLTAVAMVMLALPYATHQNAHVGVDVLDHAIGRWGRFVGDILSRVVSGLVLGVLVQRSFLKALDALKYGDATNMLTIPIWPFYAALATGMTLCIFIFVAQIAAVLGKGPQ